MWDKGINLLIVLLFFIYQFGFIWAIPYLIFFVFILDHVIPSFGYERITNFDLMLVYLSELYNTNISIFMEIDKIDFENFEKKVHQRLITAIVRMRQVPVSYFGFYFWKEVDVQLARQQVKNLDMHFEDEASFFEYFNRFTNERMEKGKPLFEFGLIEDYTEDTSMIIFRCEHSFGDGVSCASMLSALNDDQFSIPSKKVLPSYGFWQKLIFAFTTFSTLGEADKKYKEVKTDECTKKIFKKNNKQTSDTRHTFTNTEIPFEAIHKCYKRYEGMTFNDFALAICGKSFYQYCKQEGIEDPKLLRCSIAVAHKILPTGYFNLSIKNYLVLINLQLYLTDSLKSGYEKIKPFLSYILSPDIQKQLVNFNFIAPYVPKSFLLNLMIGGSKESYFCNSNVAFSDRPYFICEKQVRKLRLFNNNCLGEGLLGFIFTYNNKVTFTACVVEKSDFDGEKYTDLVMANIQEEIDSLPKQT